MSGLYAIVWLIEGPALDDGPETLKKYEEQFGSVFYSVDCNDDDDDDSDDEGDYSVTLLNDKVKINEIICETGKFYNDADLIGLGVKLRNCRLGKVGKPNRQFVISLNNNGGALMHMFGNGKHVHLCSAKR